MIRESLCSWKSPVIVFITVLAKESNRGWNYVFFHPPQLGKGVQSFLPIASKKPFSVNKNARFFAKDTETAHWQIVNQPLSKYLVDVMWSVITCFDFYIICLKSSVLTSARLVSINVFTQKKKIHTHTIKGKKKHNEKNPTSILLPCTTIHFLSQ